MNKGGKIFLSLVLLLVLSSFASAANVGVSPASIHFKNVLRNGYAERPIIITIDSVDPVDIDITSRGNISDWLSFQTEGITASVGNPKQIILSVTPPIGTPNGIYEGFLRIRSSELGKGSEGFATGLVIPTLDIHVTVEVTDEEILECRASNFKIESTEEGEDIIFTIDIENKGNIRFSPEITFDIWDQESIDIVKQFTFSDTIVIPTQKSEIDVRIPSSGLELGQYWVDINSVECYNSQTLTFDVLEEGALRANGVLEQIVISPWADIGDIVPISVNFKNTGEKSLDARFSGKVSYNNKIIQILENDEVLFTRVGEQSTFQFYFTPKQEGRYIISGRVFYDGKRTYEQSGILNVYPTGVLDKVLKSAIYLGLIITISFLVFKIRKERRTYFGKLRGIGI